MLSPKTEQFAWYSNPECAPARLASCLTYAQALIEYVFFILWVRSFSKMLSCVKFAEDKVLDYSFSST